MRLNVSVIFSTHDRPESLQRSIDSVLAQKILPYELIIVHDGTKPVSPDIAEILRVAGERFRYYRQKLPSLTRSRNQGMAMAKGEIILLLDDDVILPRDYISRLTALYEADRQGRIAGIGGVMVEPASRRLARRLWDAFAAAFALCRWAPRRNAARYLRLPAALKGRLLPARRLSGGAISLRRYVAKTQRFDESFTGYAFGEDLEFSFRVGQEYPLFVAPELRALHEPAPTGRPDMRSRGHAYVANFLHIAQNCVGTSAGVCLLLSMDIIGTLLRYLIWGTLGANRGNLLFAAGMIDEIIHRVRLEMRNLLCGS